MGALPLGPGPIAAGPLVLLCGVVRRLRGLSLQKLILGVKTTPEDGDQARNGPS